jgi:hypothetical protein
MAEFGKRNIPRDARAYGRPASAPANLAAAVAVAKTGRLPYWAKVGPLRIVFILLAAAGGFWALILPYSGDLLRDYRLAGTWQPAYDMQVTDGKCTSYNFILTICNAKIKSRPEPGKAPLAISYMMGLASGGGEILVPVRSTVDPSALTIAYAAESKLTNRTLTLIVIAAVFAAMFLAGISALLRGRYVGGAAHRALLAGFEELKVRVENAHADPRATL